MESHELMLWARDFLAAVTEQDRDRLRGFFTPGAAVYWPNTGEKFSLEDYLTANCEYPGDWDGEVEKIVTTGDMIITATRVYPKDRSASFHVTSFIKLKDGKIVAMDEYWADDGEAPKWRQDMKIGRKIVASYK